MTKQELNRIGEVLNCKSTGKPGPCAMAASKKAKKSKKVEDHVEAGKLHRAMLKQEGLSDKDFTKHLQLALEHERIARTSGMGKQPKEYGKMKWRLFK